MLLAERDHELSVLRRLFRASADLDQIAIISGPVGSGKTALLHEFVDEAREKGALLLTAGQSRGDEAMTCGVLQQLLDCAATDTATQDAFDCLLCKLADSFTQAPVPSPSELSPALRAISEKLVTISAERPLVLIIDDLQFADSPSLHSIPHLLRRMSGRPLMLVLVDQGLTPSPQAETLDKLSFRARATRIALAPLSEAGVGQMVATELGGSVERPELVSRFYDASGGSPLLVKALIDDYRISSKVGIDNDPAQHMSGSSFVNAALSCLRRCGPAYLSVASAIAILGKYSALNLISSILGLEVEEVSVLVRELTISGLLWQGTFRSPGITAAVLQTLPHRQRAKMHRDAALLLWRDTGDAGRAADHLIRSGNVPEAQWELQALHKSAQDALNEAKYRRAAQLLEAAGEISSGSGESGHTTAELTRVTWQIDPILGCAHVPDLIEAFWRGDLTVGHASELVGYLLWDGKHSLAEEIIRHLDQRSQSFSAREQATFRLCKTRLSSFWPGIIEPSCAASLAEQGVSSVTEPWQAQAAQALARILRGIPLDGTCTEPEQLLRTTQVDLATMQALCCLLYMEKNERVEHWCELLLHKHTDLEARTWRAMLSSIRATAAVRRGDLTTAMHAARSALEEISEKSWGGAVAHPRSSLLLAAVRLGHRAEAERIVQRSVPEDAFHCRSGLHYLHARGHYFLGMSQPQAALADFETCGDLIRGWGMDRPSLVPWRTDLAEAHLLMGNRSTAARLADAQLECDRGGSPRTSGVALRVLAASGEPRERVARSEQAVDMLRRSGDQFEYARAIAELAQAYRAAGDARRARRASSTARQIAARGQFLSFLPEESDGIQPAEPPAEPVADHSIDRLTEQERRVLTLAARGHSNREIAKRLFVTISTVEQHLTNSYRKLNIKSRVDIPLSI
ncbi:DNA-binding NarL/FixJ family response regulator [Streptomyces griseochromogenes]|uniref:DNA-binding NarL/FixJ family response regulator n=1 Tax=Streptomyces griseochromogenes TaxID=68214 RepID=A0A1B1AWB4_9ACTN|nr:helix-turn-helix transcriptional regulator [Streptomyces griseochromogenes]ANP50835.1 hypothetical protein AVL59_15475 [Streptomyces griseochromogenes]MBP2056682.1 DNA-binding NarL/FixJ family response regulator [Streptomyces griseochromogenes]